MVMKIIYSGLICAGIAGACSSPTEKKVVDIKKDSTITEAKTEEVDSSKLIIAGKQAGNIFLGQDVQDVFKLLGNANDGDAAMGSAVAIWYATPDKSAKKDPVVVFSSYRDSTMLVRDVKQVSVSAADFKTAEGVHTGMTLANVLSAYPGLKKSGTYVNDKKDSLFVYDELDGGIAFDILQDSCRAITVHQKGRPANALYLDLHPGWKAVAAK